MYSRLVENLDWSMGRLRLQLAISNWFRVGYDTLMRFRLRSLLIILALGPPVLAYLVPLVLVPPVFRINGN